MMMLLRYFIGFQVRLSACNGCVVKTDEEGEFTGVSEHSEPVFNAAWRTRMHFYSA